MALLSRLTELLFIETIRCYLETLPQDETGWLSALRDPLTSKALQLLHKSPAEHWTVARLAKQSGASRSALSARFTEIVGVAPMAYLTQWRMRLAQKLLSRTELTLRDISTRVGFESESAFHRAFKKEVGDSPAAFDNSHRRLGPSASS
jgi:AraC-like DNA-binding protein